MWPQSSYPLIEVGRMVLDRNPENYFAEVEQIAFAPSHLVPGIEPSPDKMLQGMIIPYFVSRDTIANGYIYGVLKLSQGGCSAMRTPTDTAWA